MTDVMNKLSRPATALAVLLGCASLASFARAQDERVCYQYDGLGRLEEAGYLTGDREAFAYDEHGNRIDTTREGSGGISCSEPTRRSAGGEPLPVENEPPVAVDDSYTVDQLTNGIQLAVLNNDTDPDDGSDIFVGHVQGGGRGTYLVAADRKAIIYNAGLSNCTETNPEVLGYTVVDQNGGVDGGEITINYNPSPFSTVSNSVPNLPNAELNVYLNTGTTGSETKVVSYQDQTDDEGDVIRLVNVLSSNTSVAVASLTGAVAEQGNEWTAVTITGVSEGTSSVTISTSEWRYDCTNEQWVKLSQSGSGLINVSVTDVGEPTPPPGGEVY